MNTIRPAELARTALANVQMALYALRAAQEMVVAMGEEFPRGETTREIAQMCRWAARRADELAERIEVEEWMTHRILEGGGHGHDCGE